MNDELTEKLAAALEALVPDPVCAGCNLRRPPFAWSSSDSDYSWRVELYATAVADKRWNLSYGVTYCRPCTRREVVRRAVERAMNERQSPASDDVWRELRKDNEL